MDGQVHGRAVGTDAAVAEDFRVRLEPTGKRVTARIADITGITGVALNGKKS